MMRTTIDIDPVVLAELKRRQAREHKSLGVLVSELLATALAEDRRPERADVSWPVGALGARVDIDDKEAMWAALDET